MTLLSDRVTFIKSTSSMTVAGCRRFFCQFSKILKCRTAIKILIRLCFLLCFFNNNVAATLILRISLLVNDFMFKVLSESAFFPVIMV